MDITFPKLPKYQFSWRSIQVEPIPNSGERITIGAIVKGTNNNLIAAKLIPSNKIKALFGHKFGSRIIGALNICVSSAEDYYANNQLSNIWLPPIEGFYVSNITSSVSENLEDGLFRAAMHCSSYCVSTEVDKINDESNSSVSTPESWRKNITEEVIKARADLANNFDVKVAIQGDIGVPLKIGYISPTYAAHFDAISKPQGIQQALVRAQSKLWQLDLLRDKGQLFQPDICELIFRVPIAKNENESSLLIDFTEELKYEASRREIELFATDLASAAAKHLILKAA